MQLLAESLSGLLYLCQGLKSIKSPTQKVNEERWIPKGFLAACLEGSAGLPVKSNGW